ncbi:Secondary metabolism regulator LAE1 [Colletotrichum siamense]|uniref:Secondary metabolism regulator LAE1 n=1 Tax=Colletotrichum siamense TaxID=690259 RepID=UPI001873349D|nr:Secondary metabolism regulator LAE1 [Colletotrichum siamense]KAF5500763.1 Secondary metabolism regulator LAE1 [Colletotrichum siamense]
MDRLDFVHALFVRALGDRLYLAPLETEKIQKILDIGTGTGIWAMEIGDIFPNAEVIGNDLSAIQPEWVSPNVKFEIDDVESPWIDDRKYDYIMCRCMAACLADWPKLMQNIYECDDGTLTEEHYFRQWNKTLVEAIASIGREPSPGPKLEGWVRNTGFQRINHSKVKIPLAPWPKDPFYKALGTMNLTQVLDGLEGFTIRVFCGVLGQTQEEAQVMMAAVRNELKKLHSFHSQFDFHIVYAQKPLEEDE